MPSPYYDLNDLKAMVFDDMDFLKEIVGVFIAQMPVDCAELQQAASQKEWKETAMKAHKIKSSVRTIGIHNLFDDIVEIEHNCNQLTHLDTVPQKIDTFMEKMNLIINDLEKESFVV
jgi:HPt (histidine-containing phosphotransfer) domain-containing protein